MSGLIKDIIGSYLPTAPTGGALPLWMTFVSCLAFFNTIQNFVSTKLTRKVYSNKQHEVTPLSSRTFAIWTLLSACLRLYTAYDIQNKGLYNLSIISYVLAFVHFTSEFAVFRTAGVVGAISPFIVSTTSLYWMISQREHYLGL